MQVHHGVRQTRSPTSRGSRVWISVGDAHFLVDNETTWQRGRVKMHDFLLHPHSLFFVSMVIFVNCITVGVELQQGKLPGVGGVLFDALENMFLVVYMVELCANLFAYGLVGLSDNWIRFDVVVVISGIVEQWILRPLNRSDVGGSNILVVLRVLRLFRLVRTFKVLVRFREMAILMKGLLSSAGITFYTSILLFVMLFIFACAGREFVGNATLWEDPELEELALRHFSSVTVAMLTLVQFVCMDSVAAIFEPMIKAKPYLAFYFLGTILILSIVLMNLVTAVMVNSSIEKAQEDKDVIMQTERDKQEKMAKDLQLLFLQLDEDQSAELSLAEFQNLPEAGIQMLRQCVPGMEPEEVFRHLDLDNSHTVGLEEFTNGIIDLAKSGTTPQQERMVMQVDHLYRQMRELRFDQKRLCAHLGLADKKPDFCHLSSRSMVSLAEVASPMLEEHTPEVANRTTVFEDLPSGKPALSSKGRDVKHDPQDTEQRLRSLRRSFDEILNEWAKMCKPDPHSAQQALVQGHAAVAGLLMNDSTPPPTRSHQSCHDDSEDTHQFLQASAQPAVKASRGMTPIVPAPQKESVAPALFLPTRPRGPW